MTQHVVQLTTRETNIWGNAGPRRDFFSGLDLAGGLRNWRQAGQAQGLGSAGSKAAKLKASDLPMARRPRLPVAAIARYTSVTSRQSSSRRDKPVGVIAAKSRTRVSRRHRSPARSGST